MLRSRWHTLSPLPDFFVLTETWLNEDYADTELGLHSYNIYRLDRNYKTSSLKDGGGVLIAVKNCYSSHICTSTISEVEHLFVACDLGNLHVIIGATYIPTRHK